MSREVDERVVQMQFDNAQFERGTRQTMGTCLLYTSPSPRD